MTRRGLPFLSAMACGVVLLLSAQTGLSDTDSPDAQFDAPGLEAPQAPDTDVTPPEQTNEGAGSPGVNPTQLGNDETTVQDPSLGSATTATPRPEAETGVEGLQSGSGEEDARAVEGNENRQEPAPLDNTMSDAVDAPSANVALSASDRAMEFLRNGGPALWAIAALSIITLALILWKIWRLFLAGAWVRGKAARAAELFETSGSDTALQMVADRRGIRSQVMATTLRSLDAMSVDVAREETARVAKRRLGEARVGLGALELISTVAPLLGLLGTVLGMIAAFQALQAAGSRADPTLLAGGIWEALLTTAAGMAVAIPASAALTWFESVIERIRQDIEDNAARVFVACHTEDTQLAAA
ncbi:MAG: MotA/TolQ/ExbB proton channel family protein [Pseudomonadota bacterium]